MEQIIDRYIWLVSWEVLLDDAVDGWLEENVVVARNQAHLYVYIIIVWWVSRSCAGARADPPMPTSWSYGSTVLQRTSSTLYQQGWPRRVMEPSIMSSATRKKACNCGGGVVRRLNAKLHDELLRSEGLSPIQYTIQGHWPWKCRPRLDSVLDKKNYQSWTVRCCQWMALLPMKSLSKHYQY